VTRRALYLHFASRANLLLALHAHVDVLAAPWDTQTAADLLWSFMFPETLSRLTGPRGWSRERYGRLLALLLVRTLTTTGPMGDPGRPSGG
jgi:hypothetical protein